MVGPRPHMVSEDNELEKKLEKYPVRRYVKPGMTGWAQVNGNYEDIEFKLHHDLYYIENMSLLLDFIILLKTIPVIILGKGAR